MLLGAPAWFGRVVRAIEHIRLAQDENLSDRRRRATEPSSEDLGKAS